MEVRDKPAHVPTALPCRVETRRRPGARAGRAAVVGLLACLAAGCATTTSEHARAHQAEVVLDRANFAIQEPIEVEVTCPYVFGGAIGSLTLPGIPLGDPALETRAAAALHDRSSGRFLVHVTRDLTCTSYLGLYSVWRLTVTADAVGFTR